MPLFDRFATVTVGRPGAAGTLIKDMRVQFDIEKDSRGAPNKGVVQIWNLSETTRNKIRSTKDVMILEAGYKQDEQRNRLTIQMDVIDVRTIIQRPDIVTAITCADGVNALRDNKFSVSFEGGKTVKSIIRDLASRAGLVLRDLTAVDDAQYQQGFAESGPIGDIFDRLAGRIDSNWSFQNGELQFAPKDAPASSYVSVVNEKTGLVGSPAKRNKVGEVNAPQQQNGWVFKSLLNPTIEPNGRVRLESEEAKGDFRVIAVKHTGDTAEGEFFSTVEVEEWQAS
jgi:hypothetical protein